MSGPYIVILPGGVREEGDGIKKILGGSNEVSPNNRPAFLKEESIVAIWSWGFVVRNGEQCCLDLNITYRKKHCCCGRGRDGVLI
jgi:hypothetical protein